jgi:hypothetical protein
MGGISQACTDLLAGGRFYAPLYGDRLANHLPMALVALDRLGAGTSTLQAFASHYAERLVQVADSRAALDPHDYLGSAGDYPRFIRFFEERIAESGVEAVVRDWVPVLLPGLAASAFHAMIRLAYAIEAGDEDEIARALAFWASEYATLPLSLDPADGSLGEIAARLHARVVGHVFKPGIIIDKMLEIAWHPALAGPVIQPERAPALRDIAGFALEAYAAHEDFTVLHAVTGCHAFRLIERFANDRALARRYLWQAVVAAYLTVQPPECAAARDELRGCALAPDDIARLAVRATDDHVIKLCYSALCEHRHYGNDKYLQVASRKLALDGLMIEPAC